MHSSRFKRALLSLFSLSVIVLNFNSAANAQHRSPGMNADGNLLGGSKSGGGGGYISSDGWFASINTGYEIPVGALKADYKGGPTFGITVGKKQNHIIFSGTVDYRIYTPKQPFYELDFGELGSATVEVSKFPGLGIYVGSAYEFLITQGSSVYLGLNGGYIFTSSEDEIPTENGIAYSTTKLRFPYIAPKVGLSFAVTNTINVGIEARYSLNLKANYSSPISIGEYTTGFGSFAGNLVLSYNF